MTIDLESLSAALSVNSIDESPDNVHRRCAVAMILRNSSKGTELLIIHRSSHPEDPWSGNLAFPGGKIEDCDRSLKAAAERETLEETGIELVCSNYIGILGEVEGTHLPVKVACFVYKVPEECPDILLSSELQDIFWLHLDSIIEKDDISEVFFAGEMHTVPCYILSRDGVPVLWGLTYRLIRILFDTIKRMT